MRKIRFQIKGQPANELDFPDSCDVTVGRCEVRGALSIRCVEQSPGKFHVVLADPRARSMPREGVATISRDHVRLRIRPDETTIEDLESTNGTFVQARPGRRVEATSTVLLGSDAFIHLGDAPQRWPLPASLDATTPEDLVSFLRARLDESRCKIRVQEKRPEPGSSAAVRPLLGGRCHLVVEWTTINLDALEWLADVVNLFNGTGAKRAEKSTRFTAVSPARRRAEKKARTAATLDCAVLLLGPTGSGKDVLARDIHDNHRRSRGPFVPHSCAELPPALFESLLFGHERGAFTGADSRRAGLVEIADGGTLFLDEIGELGPEAQAKMLRFLQDSEYRPLGATTTRRADVRIIAATNRPLDELPESRFREDLLARIDEYRIEVPPPAPEDVAELVRVFAPRIAEEVHVETTPDEIEALAELASVRHWKMNCRSLRKGLLAYYAEREPDRSLIDNWREVFKKTGDPSAVESARPVVATSLQWETIKGHVDNIIRLHMLLEERTVAQTARRLGCTSEAVYQWFTRMGWGSDGTGAKRARVPERAVLELAIEDEKRALGPWLDWLRPLFVR